ncbi:hypothetical protein BHE74_00030103 [Ensete ventricosum]|nr:hypothetical protein BHE74_00030103 [Ensete ventricosum]
MLLSIIQKVLLLAVILFAVQVVGAKLKSVSPEQELLIEERLQQFNKPAAKSIQVCFDFHCNAHSPFHGNLQSEDGDIIDCVDIYKQPALDHPLLKNHIIEVQVLDLFLLLLGRDSVFDKIVLQVRPDDQHSPCKIYEASSSSTDGLFTQVWQRSGSCPIGTIPIVRVQRHHLLNTPSIQNYGRKPWNGVKKHAVRLSNNETFDLNAENLHAVCPLPCLLYRGFVRLYYTITVASCLPSSVWWSSCYWRRHSRSQSYHQPVESVGAARFRVLQCKNLAEERANRPFQ